MKTFLLIFIIIEYFYVIYTKNIINSEPLLEMNVGTTLFTELDTSKKCWTREQIALLSSRRSFQKILPAQGDINITNEDYIHYIIEYFLSVLENVRNSSCGQSKHILLLALSDTLGGYMNHFLLPVTRFSYYCGFISYDGVRQLYRLFEELKRFLKTTGYGWSPPGYFNIYNNTEIPKFEITERFSDPCGQIIFYKNESQMVIPLPYFDCPEKPVAMAVPLKTSPVRNVGSKHGAMLLMKYYNIAIQCLVTKGNESSKALLVFKEQFKKFLNKQILPKLRDEKFYSVFGGVYRLCKDLKVNTKHIYGKQTDENIKKIIDSGSTNLKKIIPENLNYGFILIVVVLAAVIWLCIGFVYCLICCRRRKKKTKKNYCIGDDKPRLIKCDKEKCKENSTNSSICIKRSIDKIRRFFSSSKVNATGKNNINSKPCNKRVSIQNGRPSSAKLISGKRFMCNNRKYEPCIYRSDSSHSSKTSSKGTQSSNNIIVKKIYNLKSVSFSPSSSATPDSAIVNNSKEFITPGCSNIQNYGTCNQIVSDGESVSLSPNLSKSETCLKHSKPQSKHIPHKYNFKHDLENTTSSSESSAEDQLWPYPVKSSSCKSRKIPKFSISQRYD